MPKRCPECGSAHLTWECKSDTNSGVVDGRLRMHDMHVIAYLGCEYCSATIEIIKGDEIAQRLNKLAAITS